MARPKSKICVNGHDIDICGRNKHGSCNICVRTYAKERYQKIKNGEIVIISKQFCKRNHDTFVCGRDKSGGCIQCRREKDVRRKKKMRAEGNTKLLKEIAKRAYDKQRAKWIEQSTQWNKDNPEKASLNQRKSKLLKHYKLTLELYENMLIKQDNKCAVCKQTFIDLLHDPHVDHDHSCCPNNRSCGKCVRGLLCKGCNFALGSIQDNINSLEYAIEYLKYYQSFKI